MPRALKESKQRLKESPQSKSLIEDNGGLLQFTQTNVNNSINALYDVVGDEFYITSFCGHRRDEVPDNTGLLSQWRGYGGDGGFALVFDTKKLLATLHAENQRYQYNTIHIGAVVYSNDDDNFEKEFANDLMLITKDLSAFQGAVFPESTLKPSDFVGAVSFVQCASLYKHSGFDEEREVRIVALPTVINKLFREISQEQQTEIKPEKERKYRILNGASIPYLDLFESTDSSLPIEKILVGPHKDMNLRASTLEVMLRNTDIKVVCSDIPYIGSP